MEEDKLISGPRSGPSTSVPAPLDGPGVTPDTYGGEPYYPAEIEGDGPDLRRYLLALVRYKWLLVLAALLGTVGAAVAWNLGEVRYTAEGNLWIQSGRQGGGGDVAPIRQGGLLESTSWIELLLSFAVLDSVVIQERLYVAPPPEYYDAFASFELDPVAVGPGEYELRTTTDGEGFSLFTHDGVLVDEQPMGEPIGMEQGLRWTPPAGLLTNGETIPFEVMTVRDAALELRERLAPGMDPTGNFMSLQLDGANPEQITAVVNSVMERHVQVAGEVNRSRLVEQSRILENQLRFTEEELASAERNLEEWRVATISLPSDQPIAVGLQATRDPVFLDFFDMRLDLGEIRRDRERLETALASFSDAGEVRIEPLEVIAAAARSSELRRILDELVEVRSQLRSLRQRYNDDFTLIQDLLAAEESIETVSIPRAVGGIIAQLRQQEADLQARVDVRTQELEAIPPRTIEEGRLERRRTIQAALYNDLRSRVEIARLAAASSIPDISILDYAAVPSVPTDDGRLRWAALVLFGFLGAATGGAILLDRMDSRFRYASDVSRDIGLDILGSIPRIENKTGRRAVLNAAQALEAFRELRIHVGFAYGSAGPVTLTVTSPSASEGKTLISSNLAVAFAEVGRRTLLIDADTRRGDAHRLLGMEQSPGLVDYLKERSGQEVIQTTEHANLDFIGCGTRGTSTPELLASNRMAHLMGTLKRSYEVIIVDSPPLAAGGDVLILGTLTGNLAVVIRTGATERALAQAKLDQLSRLPVRILGAILNDVDPTDSHYYYYSAYLPGYEPVSEHGDENDEEGVQLISG